jgi:hypothetical protein
MNRTRMQNPSKKHPIPAGRLRRRPQGFRSGSQRLYFSAI